MRRPKAAQRAEKCRMGANGTRKIHFNDVAIKIHIGFSATAAEMNHMRFVYECGVIVVYGYRHTVLAFEYFSSVMRHCFTYSARTHTQNERNE